jgi:hypothetical protein
MNRFEQIWTDIQETVSTNMSFGYLLLLQHMCDREITEESYLEQQFLVHLRAPQFEDLEAQGFTRKQILENVYKELIVQFLNDAITNLKHS